MKSMTNNKIIAIWGNPSSGKTVTSMKIARELSAKKKNVIVIFSDLFCPVIEAVIPNCDVKNRTLGNLLSKPTIKQSDILKMTIPYPKHENIGIIGYKNGDNIFTYSDYLKERVIDIFTQLSHLTDYVIIDCSSILTEDGFTTIALQLSDVVLRLCSADLKAYAYFSSQLPLISRPKFKSEEHIKILSNIKAGQEENTFRSVYGDIAYTLPYVGEIENQFFSAELLNNISGKTSKVYNGEMKKLIKEVFGIV